MTRRDEQEESSDRTARAVAAQLHAMACERYEVGILAAGGAMLQREWTAEEVKHGLSWLKRMNAQGSNIYIRPSGSVGLILVDDLERCTIAQLTADGLAPALVVETSPGNYQAWLRISEQPISPEVATAAARIVAERYGGDPNSADWRHFGRFAGFTNRKPKHRQTNGQQPYVLVRQSSGSVAERGGQLIAEAKARLHPIPTPATESRTPVVRSVTGAQSPGEAFASYAERIKARYGPNLDHSRLDWMVCKALACSSLAVDQPYLEQAMLQGSPSLTERKVGHVEDYVARTARKVLQDGDVITARKRLAQTLTAHQSQGLFV